MIAFQYLIWVISSQNIQPTNMPNGVVGYYWVMHSAIAGYQSYSRRTRLDALVYQTFFFRFTTKLASEVKIWPAKAARLYTGTWTLRAYNINTRAYQGSITTAVGNLRQCIRIWAVHASDAPTNFWISASMIIQGEANWAVNPRVPNILYATHPLNLRLIFAHHQVHQNDL
jgi:hypothetical protein